MELNARHPVVTAMNCHTEKAAALDRTNHSDGDPTFIMVSVEERAPTNDDLLMVCNPICCAWRWISLKEVPPAREPASSWMYDTIKSKYGIFAVAGNIDRWLRMKRCPSFRKRDSISEMSR
jgi:hypothetical protein